MHSDVRTWITHIIRDNPEPISIALLQRAKFEGWLKFELAAAAHRNGATEVQVEANASSPDVRSRHDLAFRWNEAHYAIELKTANSNWRLPGVASMIRPITKNIAGIVADARKFTSTDVDGLVAFVLFPVPIGDTRWHDYLERIGEQLQISLPPAAYANQITVPVSDGYSADVVVCCFPALKPR